MRKVLTICVTLLIILLIFPIFYALISGNSLNLTPKKNINTDNKSDLEESVITEAMALSEEDFCEEALIAVLSIAENNVKVNNSENITADAVNTEYNKEFYSKLEKLYKKTDLSISYSGEKVYIPTAALSNGYTKTNENYPYIRSVASPWDCTSKDFVYGNDYSVGVSINGINYLCNEGLSSKDALKWYLPDFDIN